MKDQNNFFFSGIQLLIFLFFHRSVIRKKNNRQKRNTSYHYGEHNKASKKACYSDSLNIYLKLLAMAWKGEKNLLNIKRCSLENVESLCNFVVGQQAIDGDAETRLLRELFDGKVRAGHDR